MHGRPRIRAEGDPGADAENIAKRGAFEALLASVLKNQQQRCYTKQALEENARLVKINPDLYTAWNYRKLALKNLLDAEPDEDARKQLVNEELEVNENALKSHIKSYVSWHHRKWLVGLGYSSLDHELELLAKLFRLDGRNFHAWNYRRYIVGVKGVPVQEELDYTMELIKKSFSNYSAWHNRSALLLELFKEKSEKEKEELLSAEFNLVKQALYVDPKDQSGWFYHSWLLGHFSNPERVVSEVNMCRELLEDAEDISDWARNAIGDESKFIRLALARLLTRLNESDAHRDEILRLYDKLMETDPGHEHYYKDMRDKIAPK